MVYATQLGIPAAIALAISFELGGGYAQEQTGARPYGFALRQDAPAGTYMFMDPGQGRGPMYAILDGARGMTPAAMGGQLTGGESAMIGDAPLGGVRMEPSSPAIQVVQQPVAQSPATGDVPLRMMRPAAPQPVEAVPAPIQVSVRRPAPPVVEVAPASPPAPVEQYVAPVVAEPAPVVQLPVQQSAQILLPPPSPELAPPSPPIGVVHAPPAPVQQYVAPVVAETAPVVQPPVQQSAQPPPSPELAPPNPPIRVVQAPVQPPRQNVDPAPARANPSARQPARATPIPVRAPVQRPDPDARVTIAQATGQAQQTTTGFFTSLVGDITGTGTATSPTDTATPTGANTRMTTTNGMTATTTNGNGRITTTGRSLPTLIPGSAVSGRPDRLLVAVALGFVGFELFF